MANGPAPKSVEPNDWQTVEPNDWETVQLNAGQPVSVLSEESKHPYISKALGYLPAVAATATGLAASETGPGAVGAAALGGIAGKALEDIGREKMGFDQPKTVGEKLSDIGIEGVKQGAYELGGRALGAVGGRALAKISGIKPEVVGETISGVKLPETVGQASGKRLPQTLEHYLYASWLGKPLQAVKEDQQAAARSILAKLSKATEANPAQLAGNWERATQETRILGDKMYGALDKIPAPTVGPVAKQLLDDESLRLPGKAKDALTKALGEQSPAVKQADMLANQVAKKLGYKSWRDPGFMAQMDRLLPKDTVQSLRSLEGGTIGDAITARSELRDLAVNSPDRNLQRLYQDAYEKMNSAIDTSLTPEQRAIKAEADKVWRRSYIQEEMTQELQKMQFAAAPGKEAPIAVDSFVRTLNDLAHKPLYREAGKVIERPSKLDVLFDKPEDRKAMLDLATFLKTKYTTMGGQEGISESIARIGVALEAARIPIAAATGRESLAVHSAITLAGLAGMAHILANLGGAKLLAEYFRSTGAGATALATRIAGEAIGQKLEQLPAPRSAVSPPIPATAPAPRNPTDEWANPTN